MIYINNESNDPFFNLALEEYVFNNANPSKEYLLLWQNKPTIVVGKHQNTLEEINGDYIYKNDINVVRRLSGGGAVYHDLGNLNFTFIVGDSNIKEFDFKVFTNPVIKALAKMGVDAEFNSRNDLVIGGKKFSGNSQYKKGKKILHHGTLLFDSNLEELVKTLNVSKDKIESKGIKSVKSRVTNIREHLVVDVDVQGFKKLLLHYLGEDGLETENLSDREIKSITSIAKKKYRTWEWNYGESPKFNIKRSKRLDAGKIDVYINVVKGIIEECKIYGDFFGSGDLLDLERKFIGIKYRKEDLKKIVDSSNLNLYILGITADNLLDLII